MLLDTGSMLLMRTYIQKNGKFYYIVFIIHRSYVGVYDEKTGKMRICDAQLFHMMPYIPGGKDIFL